VSVLKPAGNAGTMSITFKIQKDLHSRIESLKKRCKAAGFKVDIATAAVRGISKMVGAAERELEEIETRNGKSKSRTAEKKETAAA